MAKMGRLLPAVLLMAVAFTACMAEDDVDPTASMKGVQDLTLDTFGKVVNGGKAALVEFYAPWCGHCKHLAPEYKALGEAVEADPELKARLVIAKVDADKHSKLGSKFKVAGFPTIKFFPRGRPVTKENAINYNGERDSESMLSYLKKKLAADKGFARIEALDELAAKAGTAAKDSLKQIADELEAAAKKLEGDAKAHGEVYVKLAKKALEKGTEYFASERARLERVIATGSVASSKVQAMLVKSSVLGGFLGEKNDAPSAKELEEVEEEEEEGGDEEEEEEEEEDEEEGGDEDAQDDKGEL